jgi:hypothetical protein
MPNLFETAPSGRSRCRGCSRAIARGELRFGERVPNPFAEGEMTLWFHPECAAYKRPEALLEGFKEESAPEASDRERLERLAESSMAHRRLPRIDGAERAPGGQARCRHCREPIPRGNWRIRLVFFEDGMFSPGGFVHLQCRAAYFETGDVEERVLHFSSNLNEAEMHELRQALRSPNPENG